MTLVIIDVSDVAAGTHPDDKVIFWAPQHRPGTTTAKHQVTLVDGVGEQELKPGPTMVQFQCRGIADTAPKLGTVPESGTATLDDVLAGSFTYTPAVVNSALERITTARDAALGDVDGAVADALAPASVYAGTGSPEGSVAASVGAVYTDRQATAGAVRWIKASGTGSSGWRVEYGDTGLRDITSLLTPAPTSGGLRIRIHNGTLTLHAFWLAAPQGDLVGNLPREWAPLFNSGGDFRNSVGKPIAEVRFSYSGTLTIRKLDSGSMDSTMSYVAKDGWPATYIGTPA